MKHSANSERNRILPRTRILKNQNAIQQLFREGGIRRQPHIDLRYLLYPGKSPHCLTGFVAGKRIGKAHQRNQMKRRMRETFRLQQHLIRDPAASCQTGFEGIFIAKKAGVPFVVVRDECRRLLNAVADEITKSRLQTKDQESH